MSTSFTRPGPASTKSSPGTLGTPLSPHATRVLLLGAGELGKEVAIELQRLGAEVVAVDRYPDAPAMQVAHRSHVVDMLDAAALREVLDAERPDVVVPEIEAIATHVLADVEADGVRVVPTARATRLTMDREGIRRLAAEELGLPTSPYRFVDTLDDLRTAVDAVGLPCVVKPVMSSSGKGQSVLRTPGDVERAWTYAQTGGRATAAEGAAVRVIVEGFVDFDSEITLLTVRSRATGTTVTTFCPPVGHVQVDGDYRESWQPAPLSEQALARAQHVAGRVTEALDGWGCSASSCSSSGTTCCSPRCPRARTTRGWSRSPARTSASSRCTRAPCSGFPSRRRRPWAGRTRPPRRARCSPTAAGCPCSTAWTTRSPSRRRRCGSSASRAWTAAAGSR
nr:formate-dependent phosphoribosylglycinamide formyltransferase [Xylanimonas allomyrinae]